MLEQFVNWLVGIVHDLGILGIFVMTFVESTFMPIPGEITMIPAGYLIQQGKMSFVPVWLASVAGSVGGASFNYWLAYKFGRPLFIRYGRWLMVTEEKLEKLELFFARHGAISTFIGRLIPGVRHYIAFPAGLARMNLQKFWLYTALGAAIWMTVLICLGYFIGQNKELLTTYLPIAKVIILSALGIGVVVYIRRQKRARTSQLPVKE